MNISFREMRFLSSAEYKRKKNLNKMSIFIGRQLFKHSHGYYHLP